MRSGLRCDNVGVRRFWSANIAGVGLPACYSSCVHNEQHILKTKVLANIDDVPFVPPVRAWNITTKIWKRRMRKLCGVLSPMTNEEFVASYPPGTKRNDYKMAVARLLQYGVSARDFKIRSFIKQEKKVFKGIPKERLIQARGMVANVLLGKRLKVIERCCHGLKSSKRWGVRPTRLFAKGLSQSDRAAVVVDKWSNFADPVCVSIDAVAFDRHVRPYQLDSLDRIYESLFPGDSSLKYGLHRRKVNKDYKTRHGIRYLPDRQRMSGDMDTSLGNCLLVAMMIEHIMRNLPIKRFDMFVDGDDSLIFVERKDAAKLLDNLFVQFRNLGHEIRVESTFDQLSGIEHCHHHLMMSLDPPRFIRDIKRSLSGIASSIHKFASRRGVRRYLKLMAACELTLGRGVPMMQPTAKMLYNGCGYVKIPPDENMAIYRLAMLERLDLAMEEPITQAARNEVERIFGFTVNQQLQYEGGLEFPSTYEFTRCPLEIALVDGRIHDWRD